MPCQSGQIRTHPHPQFQRTERPELRTPTIRSPAEAGLGKGFPNNATRGRRIYGTWPGLKRTAILAERLDSDGLR
jgi:hypothetical protein